MGGGVRAPNKQEQAAKLALEQKQNAAFDNWVNQVKAYAQSKNIALPSDLFSFSKDSQLGVPSKELIIAYYAPTSYRSGRNPVQSGYKYQTKTSRGAIGTAFVSYDQAAKSFGVADPKQVVDKFAANPGQYYSKAIENSVARGDVDTAKSYIKEAQNPAYKISTSTLQNAVNTGNDRYVNMKKADQQNQMLGNVLGGLALSYLLPGIGSAIASELGISAAAGTAIASATIQVAQGASLEDALKNVAVEAIVNTGSTKVATEINNVIKNPAVTDAIVSAGASAAKTAAAGGSEADIVKNIGGAIVGSATTSATGSDIAGKTIGGAVTGGVTGALSGAAGALGSDSAKPKDTTTTTTADTKTLDPVTQALVSAIEKEQTSPTTSTELGKVADISSRVPGVMTTDAGGGVVINPEAAGITGSGTLPETVVTFTPGESDRPLSLGETKQDIIDTITQEKLPSVDKVTPTTSTYTPTITTPTSAVTTPTTSTTTPTDKAILDLIKPTTTGTTTTPTTTGTTSAGGTGSGIGTKTTGTPTGTGTGIGTGVSTGTTVTPVTSTTPVTSVTTGTKSPGTTAGTGTTGTVTTTPIGTTTGTSTTGGVSPQDKAILDLISSTTETKGTGTGTGTTTTTGTETGATTIPVGTETGTKTDTGTKTTTITAGTETDKGTTTGTDKGVVTGKGTETSVGTGTGTGTGAGTGTEVGVGTGTGTGAGTGDGTGTGAGEGAGGGGGEGTGDGTGEETTDTTTPSDKYVPKVFIYGGTTKSTLPTTLGTGATYGTSLGTTGLTGERGAGEIESKETGKKRKNVWNEASLRLKDALGV